MPTLNWIGKDAVVRHHRDVPFRLLEPVAELSCPRDGTAAESGNLIVQLSDGRCRFIMVRDRKWEMIEARLG